MPGAADSSQPRSCSALLPGGPGERRTTKFRLNQPMLGVLSSGGQVTVDVATQAEAVDSDGRALAISLDQKTVRQRAERAVIAAERASGSTLLNKQTCPLPSMVRARSELASAGGVLDRLNQRRRCGRRCP
jgi:hypothetical protein